MTLGIIQFFQMIISSASPFPEKFFDDDFHLGRPFSRCIMTLEFFMPHEIPRYWNFDEVISPDNLMMKNFLQIDDEIFSWDSHEILIFEKYPWQKFMTFDLSNCSKKKEGECSKSDLKMLFFRQTDVPNKHFQFERSIKYIDWLTN